MENSDFCNCHMKHSAVIERLDDDIKAGEADLVRRKEYYDSVHKDLWDAVKSKLSVTWVLALIPAMLVWMGFQMAIYEEVKKVSTEVAVIKMQLKMMDKTHE